MLLIEPHRQEACLSEKPLFPEICKSSTHYQHPKNTKRSGRKCTYRVRVWRVSLSLSLSPSLSHSTDAYAHINIRVGERVWRAAWNGTENGSPIYLWVLRPWNWSRVSGTRHLSSSRFLSSTLGLMPSSLFFSHVLTILLLHDFMAILLYRLRASYLSKEKRLRIARHVPDPPLPM